LASILPICLGKKNILLAVDDGQAIPLLSIEVRLAISSSSSITRAYWGFAVLIIDNCMRLRLGDGCSRGFLFLRLFLFILLFLLLIGLLLLFFCLLLLFFCLLLLLLIRLLLPLVCSLLLCIFLLELSEDLVK
jgi:hypothetical protein